MPEADLLLTGAAEIATPEGAPPLRGEALGQVRVIRDGAIAFKGGKVAAIGTTAELAGWAAPTTVDVSGKTIVPGFVDAHAHPVWAGDRLHEMLLKLAGATYDEILAAGGGIHHTVKATRAASHDDLVRVTRDRVRRCLAVGTTTMEAKSGYGLDAEHEIAQLKAIRDAADVGVDLVPTLLAAHAFPRDAKSRRAYVDVVCDEITPRVAREKLAVFCDAFVDADAFGVDEGRHVLEAGAKHGLAVRIHADELTCVRAARLGLELRAKSLDHLNRIHADDVVSMGALDAGAATLCPATPFTTPTVPYAPARALIAAGAAVALGSDLNPNANCEGMLLPIALAVHQMKMTPGEALAAATVNSAWSLGLADRGRLEVGLMGDAVVLDVPRHEYLGYRLGGAPVELVVRRGAPAKSGAS